MKIKKIDKLHWIIQNENEFWDGEKWQNDEKNALVFEDYKNLNEVFYNLLEKMNEDGATTTLVIPMIVKLRGENIDISKETLSKLALWLSLATDFKLSYGMNGFPYAKDVVLDMEIDWAKIEQMDGELA